MVDHAAHRVGQPMRLGAASGRWRLAYRPRRFEVHILIAHLPRPALNGNCRELFTMVAVASRSIYGAAVETRPHVFKYNIWEPAMRIRILIFCALASGLASIGTRSACAQTTLEVPGPAQQNQPYIPP